MDAHSEGDARKRVQCEERLTYNGNSIQAVANGDREREGGVPWMHTAKATRGRVPSLRRPRERESEERGKEDAHGRGERVQGRRTGE